MNKLTLWKASTFALAGVCTYLVTVAQLPEAQAERQPRMHAALAALQTAQNNLEKASHDKGGHRVAALGFVVKAIEQVKQGIAFDDKHPGDNQKKPTPAPTPTPSP